MSKRVIENEVTEVGGEVGWSGEIIYGYRGQCEFFDFTLSEMENTRGF